MTLRNSVIFVATVFIIAWGCLYAVDKQRDTATFELKQQLNDANKLMESCYEDAQQFRDDWFACQRQKGFEWKEDMELMCSHFKAEEE